VWLTGLIVALDVAAAIPFARLREQRERIKYVLVRLASVVVNLALCFAFYSTDLGGAIPDFGAGWVLVANVAASAVSMVLLLPSVWGSAPKIDGPIFRKIMVYSLPLLISGVAGTAGEFIDRQMIKWLMPEDIAMSSLGIYGAATKLAVIMILFTQMYRLAAEPFFLARFGRGEFARQSGLAMKLYIVVAAAIFVVVMLAKPLVVQILGEQFRGGSHLLPILLAANALAGVVLNLSFWYKQAERTWMAIAVTGTGLIVTVILNVALIPRMGYEGAAWARLACEIAMVAVSWILVSRLKKRTLCDPSLPRPKANDKYAKIVE
jgi:O-antigen/teichoic acid export membrane protein